ncbi:MAG: hypothetical protein IJ612_06990, partial [Prevotella sp.]|nr:hypothetical protein [Prevotella sp.]
DSVQTKRSSNNMLSRVYQPVAIERSKKETRIYMYTGYGGNPRVEEWWDKDKNPHAYLAIVDERTGDKYCCRATDFSYFKYVKDEVIGKDTVKVYQTCLIFPPLDKGVKEAHLGSVAGDNRYSNNFDINAVPRKGHVITN